MCLKTPSEGVCDLAVEHVITTITNDSVKSRTIECFEQAKFHFAKDGILFFWNVMYGDGKARSRSIAASRFLTQTEAKYLIFVDSDILFTPEHMERMFEDLKAGYDLIAGLFPVRGGTQPSSHGYEKRFMLDGKIHEFEYLSSGFMGISRNLLEKIRDTLPLMHPNDIKFWSFFEERQMPDREEPIFLSEDYDFCEKARSVGVKVYIDTAIQLGHIGAKVYTLQDVVDHYNKNVKGKPEHSTDMDVPDDYQMRTVKEDVERTIDTGTPASE